LDLRIRFNIKNTDFVFGRIGRPDDGIFDSIGIKAFQKIVKQYPRVHYLIMSPMPKLVKLVNDEHIPNIHFLDPSSNEENIWAFHQSLDAMAHFRYDGESFGLNIVESMLCGKPIITHKSPIWNAHLEYLELAFSRVAEINNIEQYASFMEEFILKKEKGELEKMGKLAKIKAEKLFLIANNIGKFEQWIDESLEKFYGTHSSH
jgi:glycosyltransferase involved in cell wall biosynthesis